MLTPVRVIKALMAVGCATALAGCWGNAAVNDRAGLDALTDPLNELNIAVVRRDWGATDTALRNTIATHEAALGDVK